MVAEWINKKINDIATVTMGGTPSRSVTEYWDGKIKWMSSGEVHKRRIFDVAESITEQGLTNSSAKLLPRNTVMMAMNGQGRTRGTVAILETELTCNQSLAGIIPNENINPYYLYYNLQSRYKEIRSLTGNGGRNGLNLSLIRNLDILIPPLIEQNKIAEILSIIDEDIDITEKIIKEIETLKDGLLCQLFLKGLNHFKFKKTPVGEIPTDWGCNDLSSLIILGPQNGVYKPSERYGHGNNIVVLNDLYENNRIICHPLINKIDISENELSKYKLAENDVLVNRVSKQVTGVAKVLLVKKLFSDTVFESNMIRIRLNENEILPEFFSFYSFTHMYKKQITKVAKVSSQTSISQDGIGQIKVPLPSLNEQREITKITKEIENKLQIEWIKLSRLRELKLGLMQQLLTGKVRVPIEESEEASK
ncbi:restriction endonuclease subunit S [Aquibacillus koreensis]|uniref:Restriction endonuclease subunit S n=1 Tax=Aquibacillus koreensis TaxID=279446 RepID=A0A9X3WIK1_9BACI|nr:restriction endonuclease subunit S [Aquibacillus koreensis]MCT2534781.1 restriction endonuclease subunit S [Aquibacillus koreensis]MDC3419608.1 restriction endonuclease subunit S [Aquibacillus koreensis]